MQIKDKKKIGIIACICVLVLTMGALVGCSSSDDDTNTDTDSTYETDEAATEGLDIVDEICESAEPTDNNGSIDSEEQPVIKSITIRSENAG